MVNKRDIYDEFTFIKMVFNNGMQFLDNEFNVMSQVLSIFSSNKMKYFDYNLNVRAIFENKDDDLSYKSTNIAFFTHYVDQIKNLLILFDKF